jgi:hypothetical protein
MRKDLPSDMMNLVKLDMIKDVTVNNYRKEIKKLKEIIQESELSGEEETKIKFKEIEQEMLKNGQILTEEMQNQVLKEKKIMDTGILLNN